MIKRILCLLIVIILIFACVGCDDNSVPSVEDTLPKASSSMFVIVEQNSLWSRYYVVYHKETKIMYAVSCDSVFTVMVDAEGNPLLYLEDLY